MPVSGRTAHLWHTANHQVEALGVLSIGVDRMQRNFDPMRRHHISAVSEGSVRGSHHGHRFLSAEQEA
jgi:hypothetical protein